MKDLNQTFRFFFVFFLPSSSPPSLKTLLFAARSEPRCVMKFHDFFPPPILALVSVLIILKRFFRRKNTVQLHGLQCYGGVQIKKKKDGKKEAKKEGREVKRFWPQGNLLCGLLFLSPSVSLCPKSASYVKIANISKTKIAGAREWRVKLFRSVFPFARFAACINIRARIMGRDRDVNQEYKANVRSLFCFLIERGPGVTRICTVSRSMVLSTRQRPRNRQLCSKLALKILRLSALATSTCHQRMVKVCYFVIDIRYINLHIIRPAKWLQLLPSICNGLHGPCYAKITYQVLVSRKLTFKCKATCGRHPAMCIIHFFFNFMGYFIVVQHRPYGVSFGTY